MEDSFEKDLMRELGIDRLPPEAQEAALTRIGGVILQKVVLRAMELLSEQDQQELERITAANPQDILAVFTFLKDKLPNFDEVIKEEAAGFSDDALGVMDLIK